MEPGWDGVLVRLSSLPGIVAVAAVPLALSGVLWAGRVPGVADKPKGVVLMDPVVDASTAVVGFERHQAVSVDQ